MAFYPIAHIEKEEEPVVYTKDAWVQNYKEAFVEHPHDTSQLTLVLPDDCLLVSGPTRLRHAESGDANFHIVGFADTVTHAEQRQVTPLKAIGSRRHIFAATNQPVQVSIRRMMILGLNTLRSLYANAKFGKDIYNRNSKYANVEASDDASWFSNVEEDIFRVPIGLGIIYNSPATLGGHMKMCAGAEYFEVCTLVSKQIAMTGREGVVMEDVTLMADRCVPWTSAVNNNNLNNDYAKLHSQVQHVSNMMR